MKFYNKKHFISPNIIKLTASIAITLSVISVCFLMTNSTMSNLIHISENGYKHLINTTLNAYEKIIYLNIEQYKTALDTLYDDDLFKNSSEEEIFKYLIQNNKKMSKNFLDIFYVSEKQNIYFSSGIKDVISNSADYISRFANKTDYYITKGYQSLQNDGRKVFMITRPILSDSGSISGAYGAIINLEILKDIVKQLESFQENNLVIQDNEGTFLYHSNPEYILKSYTPEEDSYHAISTQYISSLNSGETDTVDVYGKKIHLVFKKIEGTNWTIAIKIPQTKIEEIKRMPETYKLYILFITICVLILITFIENILIAVFQKKELMVTTYDSVTNLWTKQKFESEASKIIKKHPFGKFMLIEIDIRGFKFINQNYTEEDADLLLKQIAHILSKETYLHNGIIGRGFADHFYVFFRISSVRNAMNEFKAFNTKLNEQLKQLELPIQLKFGISFLLSSRKNKDVTIQTLISQAVFAKTTIKDEVLTQYAIYNSRLLKKINEDRLLENNMEKALENHEFFVVYQPKISLKDDKIAGAEALVRWKNPDLGLLTPDKFIPLFEKNGFIKKLDFYVYEEVFKFLQKFKSENLKEIPISINMSRNHSKPDKFMHDFMNIFNSYSISPELIEVEILERSVMDNNTMKEITDLLHKAGFTVAMDDFGSGESSLNMLTTIPVDVLKFDRAFLLSATTDEGTMDSTSSNFIGTLLELSRSLNKKTIFEGVETEEQRDFLKYAKCDQVQGYFYSRPLTEEDFIEFIKTHS